MRYENKEPRLKKSQEALCCSVTALLLLWKGRPQLARAKWNMVIFVAALVPLSAVVTILLSEVGKLLAFCFHFNLEIKGRRVRFWNDG